MGDHSAKLFIDKESLNRFIHYLVNDIKALDRMLAADLFEKGIQRIGAEQELCLLDNSWRPAYQVLEALDLVNDPHFTTEHSKYNLEINMDPLLFGGGCFSEMEKTLNGYLEKLDKSLQKLEAQAIMVGILPTIRRSDLDLQNLTPLLRYHLLNEALNQRRGLPYEFRIEGVDELITKHNSIMFEGCNTSFQVHMQVESDDFIPAYNWAQLVTAPIMAAAANSPLLLGKRLWHETRIALFQQSIDIRDCSQELTDKSARVTFGDDWARHSVSDIWKEDIARFQVLIGKDIEKDSLEVLAEGGIPKLPALQIFNGSIYKWNRPCYGITEGKPHLRIENRVLPAGPTVVDEVANAAFWLGVMNGRPQEYDDLPSRMDFSHARDNFLKAARNGLETQFRWVNGQLIPASELILSHLLPIAWNGLAKAGVNEQDIDRYLGIIRDRVLSGRNGARWMLDSYGELRKKYARYEASVAITAAIVNRQRTGAPGHTWELADIGEAGNWINRYWKVEQIMHTHLFTVHKDDPIYLVANVMVWKHLRYLPVEDGKGNLIGLLTARKLLDFYSAQGEPGSPALSVEKVMIKEPKTISSEALSIDALALMRKARIGCLPVVKDKKLVGLITELSFVNLSEEPIHKMLGESREFVEVRMRDTGKDIEQLSKKLKPKKR